MELELFGFGPHLMIDGYQASTEKLADFELIRRVLDELPTEMEMTKVLHPIVQRFGGEPGTASGVSGVVIIAESHIAIHTFPQQRFISVDIFSCKAFDLARAVQRIVDVFEVGRHETHMINRGKEFPKDPEMARQIVFGEREYVEARL
jgi:S-adenosylmethionine decarboxylase